MIETVMGATKVETFSAGHLRAARTARQWSRGQLAAAMGMSVATVIGWERGNRTPEPPTLRKLAEQLNVTVGALLVTPPEEYGMAELRIVQGLLHREVAAAVSADPGSERILTVDRISHIENGYERVPDELVPPLARLYDVTPAELEAAWERTHAKLFG